MDVARLTDVEGLRGIERGSCHEDSRETDEAVEGCDELGHLRHRDAPRDNGTDAAANGDAAEDQAPGQCVRGACHGERGQDGNYHAQHAVAVAGA